MAHDLPTNNAAAMMDAHPTSYVPLVGGALSGGIKPHPSYGTLRNVLGEGGAGFLGGLKGGLLGTGTMLGLNLLTRGKLGLKSNILAGLTGSSLGTHVGSQWHREGIPLNARAVANIAPSSLPATVALAQKASSAPPFNANDLVRPGETAYTPWLSKLLKFDESRIKGTNDRILGPKVIDAVLKNQRGSLLAAEPKFLPADATPGRYGLSSLGNRLGTAVGGTALQLGGVLGGTLAGGTLGKHIGRGLAVSRHAKGLGNVLKSLTPVSKLDAAEQLRHATNNMLSDAMRSNNYSAASVFGRGLGKMGPNTHKTLEFPGALTGTLGGGAVGNTAGSALAQRFYDQRDPILVKQNSANKLMGEKKSFMVGGTAGALGGLVTSKKNKRGLGAGRGALIGAGTELGVYPGAALGGVGGLALGGLISALAQRHEGMRVPDMLAGGALGAGLGAAGGGYLGNIASRALLDDSSHSKQDEKKTKKDEETKEAGLAELGAGAKSILARVKSQFGKLRPQKGGVTTGPKATPQSSAIDDMVDQGLDADGFRIGVPRQYPGKPIVKPQQPPKPYGPFEDDYTHVGVPRQYPGKPIVKPQQPPKPYGPFEDDYTHVGVPRQVPRHSVPYDPAIHGRKIFNDVPATKEAFMGAAGKAIASGVASAGKGLANMAGKYLPGAQKAVTNAANTAGQAMFGTPGRGAATGIAGVTAAGVGLGMAEQNRINNQVDYQRQRMAQQPMQQQPMQQQPMKAAMFGALLGQLAAQKAANAGAPTLGAHGSAGPQLANSGQAPGSVSAQMLGKPGDTKSLLGPGGAMLQKMMQNKQPQMQQFAPGGQMPQMPKAPGQQPFVLGSAGL